MAPVNPLRRLLRAAPRPSFPWPRSRPPIQELEADLYESEDAYIAIFDAPGANQSDVQLKFADGAVMVRIDRFREPTPEYELRYDGRRMAADGRVELPTGGAVRPSQAQAVLTGMGTLRVTVPKADPADDGSVLLRESP